MTNRRRRDPQRVSRRPRWTAIVFLFMIGSLVLTEVLQGARAPRRLGTVKILSGPIRCERGDCYEIQVSCPEVAADARARLKVEGPRGSPPRGTILFTTGGLGTGWYEGGAEPRRILNELSAAGFRTVQLQWIDSWLLGSPGKEEGHVRLGCRPATIARWIYDRLHEQRPSTAFCATGHSGGAAQVSYMLSHYGLSAILAAVVPTGGPPLARMDRSCARDDPANASVAFPDWAARVVDAGFGFLPPGDLSDFKSFQGPAVGPCARGESSYREKLRQASIAAGDGDYVYPRTMVWFVFEGIDDMRAVAMGTTYYDLLVKMGSPLVRKTVVPDVSHSGPKGLYNSPDGVEDVRDILRNECRARTP